MSNVSIGALPVIVPFCGAVLMVSLATTCCLWRRVQHNYSLLSNRIATLEARATAAPPPTQTVVPVYNMPPYRPTYYPPPQSVGYPMAMPSAPPATLNL